MLKTNCKKAIDNIWAYLESYIDNINDEIIAWNPEMEYLQRGNRKALATVIYKEYLIEKRNNNNEWLAGRVTDYELFEDWASGLAMCGIFDYWYSVPAIKTLGDILEETETERERFTESDAEKMLTRLIYREVTKNKEV